MVFKKGESGNPQGRTPGYQDFVVRAKYLLGLYNINQIRQIVTDEAKFGELSVFDGMIMRRIVEAISSDGDKSMNSLLDRLLGKPQQTVKQEIDATIQHKGLSATSDWLAEMLGTGPAIALKEPVSH